MKIMLIDDSRAMRRIVQRGLRQAGFGGHDIVEAEDGQQALAAIPTENPDLILSDWNMPNMNGIDLLRQLRAGGSTVPFGFITSERTEEMQEQANAAGANFYIVKPFSEDDLKGILSPYLG